MLPLNQIAARTLAHYSANARGFWQGTRDHDVSQNRAALLAALRGTPPFRILDLGCGPGRDLAAFAALGQSPVGLEGCAEFVAMAEQHSGCEVLRQSFLELALPASSFDGIFANASLFHVPTAHLPRVLRELSDALVPDGVLFCSNPRSFTNDEEGWHGERYGCYLTIDTWLNLVSAAGFVVEQHFLRPQDQPPSEQPWLALVCRKPA